jgi:outer membrane beta-barrel protein
MAGVLLCPWNAALAAEEKRVEVMQNRKYELLHEISLMLGTLPVDPYYKGLTGSVGYALHFGRVVAWEVVQFTYSFNIDTKLKSELIRVARSQGEDADEFPEIAWIATSRIVLKPLYGKEALFNTRVVHMEVFLQGGPAFLQRSEATESLAFGFDVGFGFRLWLEKWVSLRFDIMELVYFLDQNPEQSLHLHAGVAFNLRGEE